MLVRIQDDFDPDKILASGQCFRAFRRPDGAYVFPSAGRALRLTPRGGGAWEADCGPAQWDFWARYFDLGRSYARVRASIPPDDGFLREAAARGAGIRILRQDPWETLVSFLISQRKRIPAIRGAVGALCARFGEPIPGAGLNGFPEPGRLAAAAPEELAACSLGYRTPYVADAARRAASGELDPDALSRLGDAELMTALRSIRGVGEKVANCVCLFAYGRCGCAPVDVWIRRIIDRRCGGENPFCRFGGCAGILQQYCFYYALQEKQALRD